jgi:hypothetical protein
MTDEEWLSCAQVLASAFPHSFRVADEFAMEVWYKALADLPCQSVAAAIWHMVKTKPAFPSIAEIRRHAAGNVIDPIVVWAEVEAKGFAVYHGHLLRTAEGQWVPVEWSDPRIELALEAVGGLKHVIEMSRGERSGLRAHFCRAYEAHREEDARKRTFEELGVSSAALPVPSGPQALLADGFEDWRENILMSYSNDIRKPARDRIRTIALNMHHNRGVTIDQELLTRIFETEASDQAQFETALRELYAMKLASALKAAPAPTP